MGRIADSTGTTTESTGSAVRNQRAKGIEEGLSYILNCDRLAQRVTLRTLRGKL